MTEFVKKIEVPIYLWTISIFTLEIFGNIYLSSFFFILSFFRAYINFSNINKT